jgi:hypothetical protein
MVRIIRRNAAPVVTAAVPPEETWHDLERSVVGLVMVLSNLDESITDQLCEDGEAVVSLETAPGLREFFLDILHERFWSPDEDFAESRRTFLAKVSERKRLKIRMTPLEEAESDTEDEKREWNLTLYAGNSRLAVRPMKSFAAMADFHAACWLFHRHGIRTREMWRTLETVLPGFHELADSEEDEEED